MVRIWWWRRPLAATNADRTSSSDLHRANVFGDFRCLQKEIQLPPIVGMTVQAKRFEEQWVGHIAEVCTSQSETL